jgi:hypothetical protein
MSGGRVRQPSCPEGIPFQSVRELSTRTSASRTGSRQRSTGSELFRGGEPVPAWLNSAEGSRTSGQTAQGARETPSQRDRGRRRLSAKPRQPRAPTRAMRSSRQPRPSATLARGCEAFGRGRVREEQQVEQARRIEVAEVRLGESAEGGLVGELVAGELERVAVGGALPATGEGR